MTPVERKDYCVGVPEKKKYKLVLNSAEKRFGGSGEELKTDYTATAEPVSYTHLDVYKRQGTTTGRMAD